MYVPGSVGGGEEMVGLRGAVLVMGRRWRRVESLWIILAAAICTRPTTRQQGQGQDGAT